MLPDRAASTDWARIAREKTAARDLPGALDAWQQALADNPASLDIAGELAALAFRLGQWDMAEKFYAHLITHGRQDAATLASYAAALREQMRFDEAADLLRTVAQQRPGEAVLWEGLGAVMQARGDRDTALVFYGEALRLDPGYLNARFLRGCVLLEKGETLAALKDLTACAADFRDPDNRASAAITCAYAFLSIGDLTDGWHWYDARAKTGTVHEVMYDLRLRRWRGDAVTGKRLFVSAEQGLGDEILFASLLPEIAADVAALGIAVQPRLVPLFRRSFPDAEVIAHKTETRDGRIRRGFPGLAGRYDAWALMGDFLKTRRARVDAFPAHNDFLVPDPARAAHWRDYLAGLGDGPKAGLLWKSLKGSTVRNASFSAFAQWQGVLATPGVRFINLQYGDTAAELAEAEAAGIALHTPQGIDLKNDLDDLAALCRALDLVIGPSNATTNLAAACGADVWLIAPARTWAALGQANYPWYPQARLFACPEPGAWDAVMAEVAAALAAFSAPCRD